MQFARLPKLERAVHIGPRSDSRVVHRNCRFNLDLLCPLSKELVQLAVRGGGIVDVRGYHDPTKKGRALLENSWLDTVDHSENYSLASS
jgi:hypothetical protein